MTKQIKSAIKGCITERVLHPGTRLPSTRQLASDLGVSRSVAVEAYEQLTAEGFLTCLQGSGTRVADRTVMTDPMLGEALREPEPVSPVTWDLRTGRANVTNFPRVEWLACYKTVLAVAGPEELDYPAVAGLPALRESLAGYLGRMRGVRAGTETVMVTAGFAQGLSLLCKSLPKLGIHRLAVEDPGHNGQRRYIEESGMRTVPVRVDEEGIDVAELAASGARAVLVTPAHQFPTGISMSPARRAALVRWAEEVDGVIIEDDYDGEFWFDPRDRPSALQGLAPSRVVYAGTASKILVPGLRLGWLVIPEHFATLLTRVRSQHDLGSDGITQCAFAELITSGMLDRHLRRVRSRYRSRREAFTQAVELHLPLARVIGSSAGLHAYLRLPDGIDESAVTAAALERSVLVHGGSRYQFGPGSRPPALVIGYSTLPLAGIAESMYVIRDAIEEQRSSRNRSLDPRWSAAYAAG
ncbi:PLP-dependent aminotransferase family protein [Streptomyces sp. NBC_00083]|uniref:MocR-like pyridoxine biosynthesis transcription factor PdxR n=1 Tax=Streptomyces sp. NBC_00083 TaxID=2975647 RepID=UPI00225B1848|nr:PLP-dependent aminotransferase family protein [Streptomyces sp. NBC_00083]MCX5382358.1 PLP-dependent aminotransferase family protein [Streptomyces sp. NBC_00083]